MTFSNIPPYITAYIIGIIGIIFIFLLVAKIIQSKKIERVYVDMRSKMETTENTPPRPLSSQAGDRILRDEETAFIFKLNDQISLALERSKIAAHIVEGISGFLNTSACVLLLKDTETNSLRIEYAAGVDKETAGKFSIKNGESISGSVMANKRVLMVDDLDKDFYLKKINKEFYFTKSFISAPLTLKDEVLGTLNVCDKKTGKQFTERNVDFLVNVSKIGAIAFQNVKLHEEIQKNYLKTITTLAIIIDAKDPSTRSHSERVSKFSVAIAKKIGCPRPMIENIRHAGLLHDIGKIGIKDSILFKPGNLTDEEFEQIKLHPIKGEEIIKPLPLVKDVGLMIRHHHEKYDGTGYPDRIKAHKIELGARILTVADSFEAMIADRPYRKAFTVETAMSRLMACQNTQFDPVIVKAFLEVLKDTPGIVSDK